MTMLSDLISRLQDAVPERNGVPTPDQYKRSVLDAVADFNRRAPMVKESTLAVTAGQATYDLPGGFMKMIRLAGLGVADGVLNTPGGLIPMAAGWEERWTVAGRKITFHPTPGYTAARWFQFAAGHALSGDAGQEEYAEMTEEVEAMVLLKAQALALKAQANDAAKEAWQYQIGDERVSKERLRAELQAQADANEAEYQRAVESHIGVLGIGG